MRKEYKGCAALIYDEEANQLAELKILDYDANENSVEVEDLPSLAVGASCEVLILTAPTPHVYKGRIHKRGGLNKVITLYRGAEAESRHEIRFKIDMPASIESLVCDGKPFPLHSPVEIRLVNISKDGMRIRVKQRTLSDGDMIRVRLKAAGGGKLLTAIAIYHRDVEEYAEYGCSFVGGGDE
ncbi:MAG: PilZ domain-containing protein [Oscillospiraceae bacterium]|jgi:hypothetical protein|nr:PilZ domain-containing protein [Oscillospiraceae bacterium]